MKEDFTMRAIIAFNEKQNRIFHLLDENVREVGV